MIDNITDLTLLKVMSVRDNYNKYINQIQINLLDPTIKMVLEDFGQFFHEFKNQPEIPINEFATWFHHYRHPDLTDNIHEVCKLIFQKYSSASDEVAEKVLLKFNATAISNQIRKQLDGSFDIDEVKKLVKDYETITYEMINNNDSDVVLNNLSNILHATDKTSGLKWRLDCLNKSIGYLTKGNFVIVAAYVDVGKTMFGVSEATFMAQQLKTGCVLWLNNEEEDNRVMRKIWKSVLNCTDNDLHERQEQATNMFQRRMHGDLNRIKFINIRSKSIADINKLFEKYKPRLVVIDQIDKIVNMKHKAFTDHDRLKNLYGHIRELSNAYCPIIGISQADASTVYRHKDTGEMVYTLYPHHRQLDGSKVGKPGEADAIIMIGRRGLEFPGTRGIHVSKNKFGDTIKAEVIFNGERARYENP